MNRNGIIAGGNWIVDNVKIVDHFPLEEKLANIISEYKSNGGSAYNILKDLVKLQAKFSLEGIGLLGNDEQGRSIITDCEQMGIVCTQMKLLNEVGTSYTDVMSVKSSGKRTFFHHRGANSLLTENHFDFSKTNARIFHLGYLLLLDSLDQLDRGGRTGASRVLQQAKSAKLITCVDLVSDRVSDRFQSIIPASLPYVDYLFLNEFEASMLTGKEIISGDDQTFFNACFEAANAIIEMGVNKWVIIHFPRGAIAMDSSKKILIQPAVDLPENKIIGSVGAGDAFAAGVLFGLHEDWEMNRCLELGVCAAASCLFTAVCSDGILPANDCLRLPEIFGKKSISDKKVSKYYAQA